MISKREKGFYISMVIVLALLLAFTIQYPIAKS